MSYINYLVLDSSEPQLMGCVKASLGQPVSDLLAIIHERNKPLDFGSDKLEAFCVDISLTKEQDLGAEWNQVSYSISMGEQRF